MTATQFADKLLDFKNVCGYLNSSYQIDELFKETHFEGKSLQRPFVDNYGDYGYLIGLSVDYLTRFCILCDAEKAFHISVLGAICVDDSMRAYRLLQTIESITMDLKRSNIGYERDIHDITDVILNDDIILCAFELVKYDTAYRSGVDSYFAKRDVAPTQQMLSNIRASVGRCLSYFASWYKGVPICGSGLYCGEDLVVTSGDFDYLIDDTLVDLKTGFKLSPYKLKWKWLVQLITYYVLGCNDLFFSEQFREIKHLVVYNPTHQREYRFSLGDAKSQSFMGFVEWWLGYESRYANIGDFGKVCNLDLMYVNRRRVSNIVHMLNGGT